MPPRLNLFRVVRPLVIQPRPQFLPVRQLIVNAAPFRGYASTKDEKPATGPNQDVLPHVSEEAIEMGEVMGETTPDISQGTPVQEVRLSWVILPTLGCLKSSGSTILNLDYRS
jgi:small subunit ribosomal protein S7